jgi:transcription elongation factor Elf1
MDSCPNCASPDVTEKLETSTFQYGFPESVAIQVTEPVITCAACGQSFSDYRGEQARTEAVERYRRVMNAPIQRAAR